MSIGQRWRLRRMEARSWRWHLLTELSTHCNSPSRRPPPTVTTAKHWCLGREPRRFLARAFDPFCVATKHRFGLAELDGPADTTNAQFHQPVLSSGGVTVFRRWLLSAQAAMTGQGQEKIESQRCNLKRAGGINRRKQSKPRPKNSWFIAQSSQRRGACLVVMSVNSVTFVAPNLAWGEARGGSIPRQWGCDRRATKPQAKFGATLRAAVLFGPGGVARSLQILCGICLSLAPRLGRKFLAANVTEFTLMTT